MVGGGGKKWKTLQHNGVLFHPEYEPHGQSIYYDGRLISLPKEAEEFITYYVNPRYDKYRNDRFNKNFFKDWLKLLPRDLRDLIVNPSLLDLNPIKTYVVNSMEDRKVTREQKNKSDRENEKTEKEMIIGKYKTSIVDGVEQAIDNYIVEPPSIFIGRGDHPLSGRIKPRIYPEDITLNIGKDMPVPVPFVLGSTRTHTWGEIVSDNTLEWIASWHNSVTHKPNYARFGRRSSFKMRSDMNKYNLARLLKKKIKKIREQNEINMNSKNETTQQLSTALFLIDRLALRVGNEKTSDQADTVGVSTLRVGNISFGGDHQIKLDFLGKDSVRYVNKVKVPVIVYTNLQSFASKGAKKKNDQLFDMIQSDTLNQYIKRFMKKLTSKVFRTYNASHLMQIELKKIKQQLADYTGSDRYQKIKHLYDMANLKVAKLCNHQKILSSTGKQSTEKTEGMIDELTKKLRKLQKQKKELIANNQKTTSINKKIETIAKKIKLMKNKKMLQTEQQQLSAGTSKINYIDPRITVAFVKSMNLMDRINGFFNESQQNQFKWAMEIDAEYKF